MAGYEYHLPFLDRQGEAFQRFLTAGKSLCDIVDANHCKSRLSVSLVSQQSIDILLCTEGLHVLRRFADTDKANRYAEIASY